ncbi:MAG: hypothetical protein WBR18_07995 [Anaerolineales bacterium]
MRGVRAAQPTGKTKAGLIVVAARYESGSHRLQDAKAYQSAGQVWTDVQLFSRQDLVDLLQSGKKIAIGRFVDLAADFELSGHVRLLGSNGETHLRADDNSTEGDDLGVPLF